MVKGQPEKSGEDLECHLVFVVKAVVIPFVHHLDDADHFSLYLDRHAQDAYGFVAGRFIHFSASCS